MSERATPHADAVVYAQANDGVRLALHRYHARGTPRSHAVVLCHGLAANHFAFDIAHEVSLARHLAQRGYEVFAVELRGHGQSDRPKPLLWAFDDYLLRDLPALLRVASGAVHGRPVHYVGHSMGGLLIYAHLALGKSSDLRSAVTVGSSLDYSVGASGFHRLAPLSRLLQHIPAVPVHLVARASSRIASRISPFERFNVWSSNVHPEHWRRVCQHGFHPVAPPVMMQLASALGPGGLASQDGSRAYFSNLHEARAPVLALAGDMDRQCSPEAAEHTLSALGSPIRRLAMFGPAYGHADHYGHFDLLIGRRAKSEVFPVIDAWLDGHDSLETKEIP